MWVETQFQKWTDIAKSDQVRFDKQNGAQKISDAQNDLAVFKTKIINPMLSKAVKEAEDAYDTAINDPNLTFEIDLGNSKSTVTAKQAVAARDKIHTKSEEAIKRVNDLLSDTTDADDELMTKVNRMNELLVQLDGIANGIDDALYAAVGPKAKFYLAKKKMEKASEVFGPK